MKLSENSKSTMIKNCRVWNGESFTKNSTVIFQNGKISAVGADSELAMHPRKNTKEYDAQDGFLLPGFIDLQCNGGGGFLFNTCKNEFEFQEILHCHRVHGSTTVFPTFMTDKPHRQSQFLSLVSLFSEKNELCGIHWEGPFLNPKKCGIHDKTEIRKFQKSFLKKMEESFFQGKKIITVAPEMLEEADLNALTAADFTVLAGHSLATSELIKKYAPQKIQGVTHLFNAMSTVMAREVGLAGSGLLLDDLYCTVIADGHHVCPESLELIWKLKPRDKIILVSDAMAPFGTDHKTFSLNGRRVFVKEKKLVDSRGTLAGSHSCIYDGLKNIFETGAFPLEKIVPMTSTNAAKLMGLDHKKGHIESGFDGDVVLLDKKDYEINGVFFQGECVKWLGH